MKKMVIFLTALAMIAGFSTVSFADIDGSLHDLEQSGEGICIYCHTPHNGDITLQAPLWDHAITTGTFDLYETGTASAAGGNASILCLSCHDGVTNIDAFGGDAGTQPLGGATWPVTPGIDSLIGTDLTNDHPVMKDYPSDWSTTGDFNDPGALSIATVYGAGSSVECSSCHDPHGVTGVTKFLRASNSASVLCLDCHNK